MTVELSAQLNQISSHIESLLPFIQDWGSDEQQQLISGMHQSVNHARLHYEKPIPVGQGETFFMWRHEAIRPMSLCINSSELLLTDEAIPLSKESRQHVQAIFDLSVTITNQINAIFEQRIQN